MNANEITKLIASRDETIAKALTLRLAGKSLYAIAIELKVSKEWLRTYAGIR